MKVDAVFEGGGVKGIAFLGAVQQMEQLGYKWERLAGTSAGSIISTFLAAGFSGAEILSMLLHFPYQLLEKRTGFGRIPFLGPWININLYNGIYNMSYFEEWMDHHLRKKGIGSFGDLPDGRLKIVIADMTQNRMSILPDDLPHYGINPETFPLSLAVRMSCSIPFFFRPAMLSGNVIVDGSVLSSYPIWIFDREGIPRWPTFGFRLAGPSIIKQPEKIKGPVDMFTALIRTMMEGHDNRYINSHSAARTVFIKNIKVSTTHFRLNNEEKLELVELGRQAVIQFLTQWDFQQYIKQYRSDGGRIWRKREPS